MVKVRYDIGVDAWIRGIEIEADSIEEAEDKLYNMSLNELIELGDVKDFSIDNIDSDVISQPYKVMVSEIIYEEAADDLPSELEVEVEAAEPAMISKADVEDAVWLKTSVWPESFQFEVIM